MLKKVAECTPFYFIGMIINGIIWGAMSSATALFSYNLLNAIDAKAEFSHALRLILMMALLYLFVYAWDKLYWHILNPLVRQKLHLKMHEELFRKAQTLDLSCFDDPRFYTDFVWAMDESDRRAIQVVEDTGQLIMRMVGTTTLFGLLMTIDPIIALTLFFSSVVSCICNLIGNKMEFEQDKTAKPLHKKKNYINRIYHLSDYAKELRISHADDLLMKEYDENTERLVDTYVKYGKKQFLFFGLGWEGIGYITYYGILLYMIAQLSTGSLAIGGFAASISVVWQIRWQIVSLIEQFSKYPQHSLYIEKYLEFLRFEPKIKGERCDLPPFESLELRNVSFSYEFSSHPQYKYHTEPQNTDFSATTEALQNVNLKINAGDKIAIVGYNGAGKTTLIKLIMRLYDPTEGEILYNGINIKEFDPPAYRQKIGTVFQDFKIFAATIAENVINGTYNEKTDKETVLKALEMADFSKKLFQLKDGLNTHLTREFEQSGTNLSGGESQKVAIARVFAQEYPLVIMDEPSSALDPTAEYILNQSILHNTQNKTVIFISHRLSTTRIADKIYMFDTGRLIEEGNHSELLSMNGKYAEMFRMQSEKYQID